MDVLHLSEIDSTSTYAAELLVQGKAAPFMVHADSQTTGRGRRGNRWDSVKGNLFVTIALPSESVPPALAGLLPLKAGVVLAQILRQLTGLRLTLKWPNDLLFGGCKLGGLLLESSLSGQQFGDLLIGIGLNCASAPKLADAYATTCLQDLLGRPVAAVDVVQQLAKRFIPAWSRLALADVVAAHAQFAIAPGHVLQHDQAGPATLLGLTADGGLRLNQASGVELVLTSADHGWRWIHQQQNRAAAKVPLLLADIGNSAIKLARFASSAAADAEAVEVWSYVQSEAQLGAALRRLVPHPGPLPVPLFVASVRPVATAQLSAAATAVGLQPHLLAKRAVRCTNEAYPLSELGFDRLAGIEAWLATVAATQRAGNATIGLIVQAGTATTIDAVRASGEHLGGLILPGLTLALRSLNEAAALLPLIRPEEIKLPPGQAVLGHDTRSAMLHAVVAMTVGAVEQVVVQLTKNSAQHATAAPVPEIEMIVSGGWAHLLAPHLKAKVDADLVLKGTKVIALGGLVTHDPTA